MKTSFRLTVYVYIALFLFIKTYNSVVVKTNILLLMHKLIPWLSIWHIILKIRQLFCKQACSVQKASHDTLKYPTSVHNDNVMDGYKLYIATGYNINPNHVLIFIKKAFFSRLIHITVSMPKTWANSTILHNCTAIM